MKEKNAKQQETVAAQEPTPMPTPMPTPTPMPAPTPMSMPMQEQRDGGTSRPGNSGNNMQENMQDNMGNAPMFSMPDSGEGGFTYPGGMGNDYNNNMERMGNNAGNMNNMLSNIIGTIISTYPRPNEPCRLCNPSNTRSGFIRFLNAATGYNPFVVFVNDNMVSSGLNFAEVTEYQRISAGRQMITVMGENGYTYVQKPIDMTANSNATVVIVNREGGLDIQMVDDTGCDRGSNMSCIRAANFAQNSGPLSVTIGNQYVNFPNLRYRDVADFETIWPGLYLYTVSRNMMARFPGFGGNILLTAALGVQRNRNYTIYLLSWKNDSADSIKALIVEDM